jgi:hypothetical protein
MRAVKTNEYTKPNKLGVMQTNYAYQLIGTAEELENARATKSAFAKGTDEPVWITSRFEGESIDNVVITKKGFLAADKSEERKLLQLAAGMGKAGEVIIRDLVAKKLRKAEAPVEKTATVSSEALDALDDLDLG